MIEDRLPLLKEIYSDFSKKIAPLNMESACKKGCGYCCKAAGSIDITTLEGLAIRAAMEKLPKPRQKSLTKSFRQEIRKREKDAEAPCPFLMKNNACMIYDDRPFSCRRIHSTHVCTQATPPLVSRKIMEIGDETIKRLQQLDITGYSGHLSYIIYMLSTPAFLETYLKGACKPEEIMEFGKSHKIIINKMMVSTDS